MLPVCLSSLPRCFTSPCQACKGSCTLPPCIHRPRDPPTPSCMPLGVGRRLMPCVQPASSSPALAAANVAMSSRGAALTATKGAALVWVEDMHPTPRSDPYSQKRKALLIQCVCRVCCLDACRGLFLLRTMWAKLQSHRQKMLSLCWPWKAPQHVALGPALMMRLMTAAAASAAEDGGVSWWPRSTLEQQGAGATAAGKPTRRRRWRSSTGHAARFGRLSQGRC